MAAIANLFASPLYRAHLPARTAEALNAELLRTCLSIAQEDHAGQSWCKAHDYHGYTSYASLDDLPTRASVFDELLMQLKTHVRAYVRAQEWDLQGRKLALDSLWINVMEAGSLHTSHIHPHAVLSGTYYVAMPKGAATIQFEDPRLAMMMAAPPVRARARMEKRRFVEISPTPGTVLLWESYIRHAVALNKTRGKRVSISFNYALD